ncbi:DNA-binding protein RFXANK-like isoform X2 [Cimex lectularius]|uniref:Uncharacterized protein n=1 Tax=Cimex lectularius TaxID=79782 RepID=A0A8I6RBH2_CIMLE|nr:DNA-binding protein RFXANK-like isoform X2 [Cimex lectularius]
MDYQSKQTQTTPTSDSQEKENNVMSCGDTPVDLESSPLAVIQNDQADRNDADTDYSPLTSGMESVSTHSNSGMEMESTADANRLGSESTLSNEELRPLAIQPCLSSFSSFTSAKSFNGITWPSSSLWEDGPRRSAFLPYKPTTVLTNLQRGNIRAEPTETNANGVSWFEKAGCGNITLQDIKNVNVDQVDKNGLTALMWSSAYGQTASVVLLIKEKADIHIQGNHLETALHLAAAGGHHDIIRVLISNGADVNAEDEDGNSPLLYAVFGDHAHAVNELIENGCDLWEPNNFQVKAYNLAVEQNCIQARTVIEEYLKQLVNKL